MQACKVTLLRRLVIVMAFWVNWLPWQFASAQESTADGVTKLPEFTKAFRPTEGWLGADAIYSAPLDDGRLLWIFDDTFIGKIVDGKRQVQTMVNNTLAVQERADFAAPPSFVVRKSSEDKPVSFVAPQDGKGWYWQCAAIADAGQLHVFCQRVVKADGNSEAFGFAIRGTELVTWGEAGKPLGKDPLTWPQSQLAIPSSGEQKNQLVIWGAGVMRHEEHVYIYGTRETKGRPLEGKQLIVARAPRGKLAVLSHWEYWDGTAWQKEASSCAGIAKDVATELSVSYDAKLQKWILIHSEKFLAPGIMVSTAPSPTGPWSEPVRIYKALEAAFDKRIFCYAAKGHATLSKPGELVISYVTNSHEFAHAINDNRVYWPIFIKADLTKLIVP